MKPALVLTDSPIHLRLQAPMLEGENFCVRAEVVEAGADAILWRAAAHGWRLEGRCSPAHSESGDVWYIEFELHNDAATREVRVSYPYAFYRFDAHDTVRAFDPLLGSVLESTSIPIVRTYPGPASFCLTLASGQEYSLAMGLFNAEQRHTIIRHVPAGSEGQLRLTLGRVQVEAYQSCNLPQGFIAIGRGWSQAMKPYREFVARAFSRGLTRSRWYASEPWTETRQAHCLAPMNPPKAVQGVWIFDDEGHPRTYDQIAAEVETAVRDGRENNYKPLFYGFGWWQNMVRFHGLFLFDSLCGDYTAAHELTRRVIELIHRHVCRVYLYVNFIAAGDESRVYQEQPELFVRDAAGFPALNEAYPMYLFCPGAQGLREYWDKVLRFVLCELDADGIFLDQACGGTSPQFCYALAHGHRHPDTYGADFVELLRWVGARARELKPDCYLGGELIHDARGALLDECHGYGYTGPRGASPPAEYFVFARFLCPHLYHSPHAGALALMNGASGQHANALWRQQRAVFESEVRPCGIEAGAGLAYLFGPHEGRCVLAMRSANEDETLLIRPPCDVELSNELPAGLSWQSEFVTCRAGTEPQFYVCNINNSTP